MIIQLTQGQVALVDDEDAELVGKYKWHAQWNESTSNFYAITTIRKPVGGRRQTGLSMHRLLMGQPAGLEVDHIISMATLDNRRCNLRIVTRGQNQQNSIVCASNTSGVLGVYWHKASEKWLAQICVDGKVKYLGTFSDFQDAVEARNAGKLKYHTF